MQQLPRGKEQQQRTSLTNWVGGTETLLHTSAMYVHFYYCKSLISFVQKLNPTSNMFSLCLFIISVKIAWVNLGLKLEDHTVFGVSCKLTIY